MKKIFTLIAVAMMALGVNAQINFAGLSHSDFTYTEGEYQADSVEIKLDSITKFNAASFSYVKGGGTWCTLALNNTDVSFRYKNSSTKSNFFVLREHYFTVGGKGVELNIANVEKGQKIVLNIAVKDKGKDPGFVATNAILSSGAFDANSEAEAFIQMEFTASADGIVTLKNNSNGYLLESISFQSGTFVLPDGTYFIQYPGEDGNSFEDAAGFKLQITGDDSKNYGKGNEVTIDGVKYRAIKLSNGAENTLTLPAGKVAKGITFYSYVNADALDEEKPSFWEIVADSTFKKDDLPLFECVKGGENLDVRSYSFVNGKLEKITFKNKGMQCCFVIKIDIEAGDVVTPEDVVSGIKNVKVINANTAIYNLAGQKVAADYKGLVIENGKKVVKK